MRKIIKLKEQDLQNLVKKALKEQMQEPENYMFFSNLQQIKRQCDMLRFYRTVMIGLTTMLLKQKQTWTKFSIS
jgi:hypothetical protein